MVQKTQNLREQSRLAGVKRVINTGVILASGVAQFERDSSNLKVINRQFGYMNFITVTNNSTVNVAVDLDFTTEKRFVIPASSMITVDSVIYQEFNVTNLSATTPVADKEIYVTVGYERPLMREPPVARRGLWGV